MTVEDIREGRRKAIELEGLQGLGGILSDAALQAAAEQPYNGHFREIWKKAAVLLRGIAKGHPFVDGNKRSAAQATLMLINRSGYRLFGDVPTEEQQAEFVAMIVAFVANDITFEQVQQWFRRNIQR